MAIYTNPQIDQRREDDEMVLSTTHSAWLGIIVMFIALVLAASTFIRRPSGRYDEDGSCTGEPVTVPSSPDASPIHPAPTPNPGP